MTALSGKRNMATQTAPKPSRDNFLQKIGRKIKWLFKTERSELAELRSEIALLRSEIAPIRTEFLRLVSPTRNNLEYENKRRMEDPLHLDRYGYKVYSQRDEDGIIQEIFNRIGTTNNVFVEFGVGDGLENNTHFLLFNGWKGLWIDGNEQRFKCLQEYFSKPLSTGQLTAVRAFITTDNINKLIGEEGNINGEIDFLSIDIDGNDYWIWEKIVCIQPRVVVIECNIKFPPPCEWIMEYDPHHQWDGSDKYGASIKSLEMLGSRLGYALVGTSRTGANVFFVKRELTNNLFAEPATAENLYHAWRQEYVCCGRPAKKYIGNCPRS